MIRNPPYVLIRTLLSLMHSLPMVSTTNALLKEADISLISSKECSGLINLEGLIAS